MKKERIAFFLVSPRMGLMLSTLCFSLVLVTQVFAQDKSCNDLLNSPILSSDWVQKMAEEHEKQSSSSDPNLSEFQEKIKKDGIQSASINKEVIDKHSSTYTNELPLGDITNQEASGRCWIFAGTNLIRSALIQQKKVDDRFSLSKSYLYFFHLLEQSNAYAEDVMKLAFQSGKTGNLDDILVLKEIQKKLVRISPDLTDGGHFEYFTFLAEKYGLVPESIMPETASSKDTELLLKAIRSYLIEMSEMMREQIKGYFLRNSSPSYVELEKHLRAKKAEALKGVYKILATHLGAPPQKFSVQDGKKSVEYTPINYVKNFLKFNKDDYVVVSNFPTEKNNQLIVSVDNSLIGVTLKFLNLSVSRMEQLVKGSIDMGIPVWFSADINQDIDRESGILHPKLFKTAEEVYSLEDDEKYKALRRSTLFKYGALIPTHAMLIVGYDQPSTSKGVVKFKVENSWGKDTGDNGIFHMYRMWFRKNVFEIVVPRKLLTSSELSLLL